MLTLVDVALVVLGVSMFALVWGILLVSLAHALLSHPVPATHKARESSVTLVRTWVVGHTPRK